MIFQGYKTYMIAAVMLGLSVAMIMGVQIPEEVWAILGALGLGTLRSAVEQTKAEVKETGKEVVRELK